MIRLTRKVEFEASHAYQVPGWTEAENRARFGKATRLHGHNWRLHIGVVGETDPRSGMVVNIKTIDALLRKTILPQLDHKCLHLDVPLFRERVPTTENLTLFVWGELVDRLPERCRLVHVRVCESESLSASYRGERRENGPMVRLTRAYEFSASHRLHTPELSNEENRRLYGKCNNLHGHGHNYRVEITVAGPLDPETGTVVDLEWLDRLVEQEVLDRFDYRHMNTDIEAFREAVPTSENVVRYLYETLSPHFEALTARLWRVRLYETHKSWFDYGEIA